MARVSTVSTVFAASAANPEPAEARPRWVVVWFAALLTITIVARVADPTGWLGSDDATYFTRAEQILSGQKIGVACHHGARAPVVVPVALSIWLFGKTAWAVALPTVVASVLCVALVAVLGRLLWGWWQGLAAAAVVAFLPYFRVLSSTAYPDVHASMWATLAAVLALTATSTTRRRTARLGWAACGAALGLATAAKIFSGITVVAVLAIACTSPVATRRWARASRVAWLAIGGAVIFLANGLFYAWAADDFWYKWHALSGTQSNQSMFAAATYGTAWQSARLVWDRMAMLLQPAASGWGILALGFWPAALSVFVLDRRGRAMGLWAIATYLLVAFMPVSLENGIHPYPSFHGRHVLTASVPFALCFAWAGHRLLRLVFTPGWTSRAWPVALLAIVGLSYANPHEMQAFRHRATQRLGLAVERLVCAIDWDDRRPILMTPALYLRCRILFPTPLQARLRVAADEDAPTWWRQEGDVLLSRQVPLLPPTDAYLLATPSQLAGRPEWWDYEVGLPTGELEAWRRLSPLGRIGVTVDGTIIATPPVYGHNRPFLLLLADKSNGSAIAHLNADQGELAR
ncbi:MAG: glycosyltransferase family 39 protein [Planctomycetota bacterium]|jgi:4-amino-4-deoxy-L-arabinose transferase-like glycosyltransferase